MQLGEMMLLTAINLASVERYDEAKNEWEAVVDMGTARFYAGVASTGEVAVAGNVLQENAASLDD